jgi:hypothetical protein
MAEHPLTVSLRKDTTVIYERLRIFVSSRKQELAPERAACPGFEVGT